MNTQNLIYKMHNMGLSYLNKPILWKFYLLDQYC